MEILHADLSGNASLVRRFHREAKIASKLQHPHVVDVYFTGQLHDGALYIVMEYLDGMVMEARRDRTSRSPCRAVGIGLASASTSTPA